MAEPSSKLLEELAITGEIMNAPAMTDRARRAFAAELAEYPEGAAIAALHRCRRELSRFPALADVISRIDDGRPGAEEAWAMIPKSEDDSVVWTDEMREAFGIARSLLDDEIAARMAFREAYLRLTSEARAARKPTRWGVSLGLDPSGRLIAVQEAVRRGRLTAEHARAILPEPTPAPTLRLAAPETNSADELTAVDPSEMLAKIKQLVVSSNGDGAA